MRHYCDISVSCPLFISVYQDLFFKWIARRLCCAVGTFKIENFPICFCYQIYKTKSLPFYILQRNVRHLNVLYGVMRPTLSYSWLVCTCFSVSYMSRLFLHIYQCFRVYVGTLIMLVRGQCPFHQCFPCDFAFTGKFIMFR